MMSLLGGANDSVNLVKAALDTRTALATAEEKEKLADAKLALANLKETIAELTEENQTLTVQLKKRDEYSLDKGVYWRSEDTEQNQPFCPVCYAKGNIVPLKKSWDGYNKTQSPWHCPDTKCSANFNPWDYKEPDDGDEPPYVGPIFNMSERL